MFTKNTLTDEQARGLVVVVGTENESGIEMMAGTSGNLKRGVITISFRRFKNTQEQLRAMLGDEEFWQLLTEKRICGASAPIGPTPFERLLIEDHEHDEVPDDEDERSENNFNL
jgi:hypothetical protein